MISSRLLIFTFYILCSYTFLSLNPIIHSNYPRVISKEMQFNKDIYTIQQFNKSKLLQLEIINLEDDHINIILNDNSNSRFKLPEEEPFPFFKKKTVNHQQKIDPKFKVKVVDVPFSISIVKPNLEVIFKLDTENFDFAFEENYLDFTVLLPSKYLYGLGERIMDFKFQPGIYTIYNKDQYDIEENGKGGNNIYGSHPMYLVRDKSGSFHVNYLRNSLPMDAIVKDHEEGFALNYKVLGGIIDFHFFIGDENPDTALSLYHRYLGGFNLPPFWAMGWHQSRWGYTDQAMVNDVFEKYKEHKLPMDVFWLDIDYMDEYISFTIDDKRYNNTQINNILKEFKKKLVVIVEPNMGIKKDPFGYTKEGEEKDLFIKNHKGDFLLNKVWPGKCYFVDYFHPETKNYWHKMLRSFHETINFSGVWLDMNEVAALTDGEIIFDEKGEEISCQDPCQDSAGYPYLPGNTKLEKYTICPNAKHFNNIKHVNVHNYYPNQQAKLTNEFLTEKNKNEYPFILSRANAPGMGKFAAHWTGDNQSTFKYLKTSIAQIFNFNIFGIPMTGADVCGYGGINPSEELCAKWMQLGTLYPFSRQHSNINNIRKEPWQFNQTMLTTSLKTLKFRYSMLKFYYSLFIRSRKIGTIFKPVFFEFSNDEELLNNEKIYNQQFMIGSELLVIPNLEENKIRINAYFPRSCWYDLRNDEKFYQGATIISAGLNEIAPIFIREGKTIFLQNAEKVENSFDLKDDLELLVALNEGTHVQSSEGYIPSLNDYNNMANVENCILKDCNMKVKTIYIKEKKKLKIKINKALFVEIKHTPLKLNSIKVYGISELNLMKNNNTSKIKQNSQFIIEEINCKTLNYHTFELKFQNSILISDDMEISIQFF